MYTLPHYAPWLSKQSKLSIMFTNKTVNCECLRSFVNLLPLKLLVASFYMWCLFIAFQEGNVPFVSLGILYIEVELSNMFTIKTVRCENNFVTLLIYCLRSQWQFHFIYDIYLWQCHTQLLRGECTLSLDIKHRQYSVSGETIWRRIVTKYQRF